jgi:hypothetical protein
MSRVLNAREICERALRAIGKFPVTDTAPDGEDLREALFWLDLVMAEVSGTTRLFFLIPASLSLTLEAGEGTYNLSQTLGSEYPTDGIQFPVGAWLEDGQGNRTPLEIIGRQDWQDKPDRDETGTPCQIYIDRLPTPTLYTLPTLHEDDTGTWTVILDVQTYAPNVSPAGVSGTRPQGSVVHQFRQAWQRWLVYQLAHDLGSGPIVKIANSSIDHYGRQAAQAKAALLAFENREHDTMPPVAEPYFMDV